MLQEKRDYYRPFDYPKAYDIYRLQQSVHWTKDEIKLSQDLLDWEKELTDVEKTVIGGILKGFTQMEIMVGDYWRNVPVWFPKPEIAMMASAFSYFEGIHQDSYGMINEQLGLDDFKAFLYDESTKNKIDYFIDVKSDSLEDRATSLAAFSAFAEGVMLFSSFSILLSFQTLNLMKGVSQIVSFSIRDENLHSQSGCWLFNTLCDENPNLRESIKERIYSIAQDVHDLEMNFISNLFKGGSIRTLTETQLKAYIKHRLNNKLKEIGYEPMFLVNQHDLEKMSWFDMLAAGKEFGDFFAVRVTEYTKVEFDQNDMW